MTENTVLDNNVSSIIEKKETIPNIRFSEFTGMWEKKQLKNFMQFKNGLNADKDKFGSGVKFISVMDILNNPYITYELIKGKVNIDSNILKAYSVTYGDVLFQRSSETRIDAGKSNVYLDKNNVATFGGFVIRGRKNGNYNPEFMNSLLKTNFVRKEISSKAQGAQHFNVGQETLENVVVFIPELAEQEKIASFLTSIDNIISTQESNISILETYNRGLISKIFKQEIRFKDDNGNEFPDWIRMPLEENIELIIDNRGKTPPLSKSGYPLIEINAVGDFFVNYSKIEKYVNENIYHTWFRKHLKNGDILFSTVGTTALCSCYDEKQICCVAQNIVGLRFQRNIDNIFMYYLLTERGNNKYIKSIQMNGVQPSIKITQFTKLKFPIPCLEEQNKIANFIYSLDNVLQEEKNYLEYLKAIKKGLLQQMFV